MANIEMIKKKSSGKTIIMDDFIRHNDDKMFIDLALKEKYIDEKFTWWESDTNEIHVKFGSGSWSPSARLLMDKIIKMGKNLHENPHPTRLISASMKDISQELSQSAYQGTSWSPEDRGVSARAEYVAHFNNFHDELYAKVSKVQHEQLKEELTRYKEKYLSKIKEQLGRHSSIASTFITGESNFPSRQMNKRNDVYSRKQNELFEWIKKAQKAIKKRLGIIKSRTISSDDPTAIEKLESKIKRLTNLQDRMKKANKIVRSKKLDKDQKIKELEKIEGLSESSVYGLFKPDYMGRIGFPSFELTNNGANIRRLKERVKKLSEQRSQDTTSEKIHGVEIIDNVEANRLQLFFPNKPSREIIQKLKSNGFRWTPSIGAWQSYRNNVARPRALKIINEFGN